MTEKLAGICEKHGPFILREGCPGCLGKEVDQHHPKFSDISFGNLAIAKTVELPQSTTITVRVKPEVDAAVLGLYAEALKLEEYAESREITTSADLKPATDDLSLIAKLKKALGEKRTEYLAPLQDNLKAVGTAFDTLLEPILAADKINRDKMLGFAQEEARKKSEEEEINRLRMEAAQKEAELNGGEITESVNLVEVRPEAPERVRTDLGMAGMTDHWKYEVFDFALLDDAYKVEDNAMLNSIALKHHDNKKISGVRFFNKPFITVRAK